MLQKFKDLSIDRIKVMTIYLMSLLLAFGFGYLIFRYEEIEINKEGLEIVDYDYVVETALQ